MKTENNKKTQNNKPANMSICRRYDLLTAICIERCDVMQFGR